MKNKVASLEKELQEKNIALQNALNNYTQMYEYAPDMYVSVRPEDATIKACNQTLCSKTGYTKEEIINSPIFFLYHPDCLPDVEKAFQEFKLHGKVTNAELALQTKSGKKIPVLLDVEAIKDAEGNITHSNSSWRDITDLQQLRDKLKQANVVLEKKVVERTMELAKQNAELEQFLFIATHDMLEPFNTINNYLTLLRDKYENQFDSDDHLYTKTIYKSSNKVSHLLKGLLDYYSLGKTEAITQINLNNLITDVKTELLVKNNSNTNSIEIDNMPVIFGYERALKGFFYQMLQNAIKFKQKGTRTVIKVSATEKTNQYCIAIQDNGIGIDPKHHERIFKIFQKLHNEKDYNGVGIGLALSKKIAEIHNGTLAIDSSLGNGSRFTLTLPKHNL